MSPALSPYLLVHLGKAPPQRTHLPQGPSKLVWGSADRVWGEAQPWTLALNTVRNAEHVMIYLTGKDKASERFK